VDLKLTFCPNPHYPQSTLTPRNTSPRKNPHSLRCITNAELRYRKDRRFYSRTHYLAENTVGTISTHLHHFLRLHSSYGSHPQTRSPIVLFSASENISSSFPLHHDLRISFRSPSFPHLIILHIPSNRCRTTFMIFFQFCGVPIKKNATIYYKMFYYKIGLIKVVNKGSESLS